VWREGHCGIPLLHRFPKRSAARVYYAALLRILGFGRFPENKTIMGWSRDFCEWLDEWTFYRSYPDLAANFAAYFSPLEHLESDWLVTRLGPRARFVSWCPAPMQRLVVSKLSGRVFVCTKVG
jgi:hypothetical protein